MPTDLQTLRVIDSHTAGEPTRVVLEGGIALSGDTMLLRREDFRSRFDHLRTAIIHEPRGSEVWVGAALTAPVNPNSTAGIVFFNNAGYLGMCGHGAIGVVQTLRYLGRIQSGAIDLDTPAGTVTAVLHENGEVSIRNVVSYRYLTDVCLDVEGVGPIHGDVAYGGNWFFLVHSPTFNIVMANAPELTAHCLKIKAALAREEITGAEGAEIDHIELSGAAVLPEADSRNFVLCPGGAYDRSPCGTGTSAKLAVLYARGELPAGRPYLQESISGGVFRGSVEAHEGGVAPTISGMAHITADSTLIFSAEDPLRWGLT